MTDETPPNNLTRKPAPKRSFRAEASRQRDARELAREVLFATARYMRIYRKSGWPDDVEISAAARLWRQYEGVVELIDDNVPSEDIGRAIGIYVAKLELLIAQLEAELMRHEKQGHRTRSSPNKAPRHPNNSRLVLT